jgi:SRSO17 transposase
MKTQDVKQFKEKLEAFLTDIVVHMGRKERRCYAEMYLRGLMMNGERKSIEPMALRLPDGNVQALQQFVNQSPWSFEQVRASLARKVEPEFVPEAYWIIDEVSFPKKGTHSVGVARQYCGALGKTANCQVAVTVDLGTEQGSVPLNWALYLPEQWVEDPVRRKKAGIPEEATFKTKLQLALELIDEVSAWGLQKRLVLADSAYGDCYEFRKALRDKALHYVVQVEGALTGWTEDPHPSKPLLNKRTNKPRKRLYAADLPPTKSLKQIAQELPAKAWRNTTWREGSKGPLRSRFARTIVWPANGLVQGKTARVEPEQLLIEWPKNKDDPLKFWLSSLNPKISRRTLIRRAKGRFRIEQDYREMKNELGLDHFEGRAWQGWHHHVTLVAMAYCFLMLERIGDKKNFWIDIASCPPMDPDTITDIYGGLSHLWQKDSSEKK